MQKKRSTKGRGHLSPARCALAAASRSLTPLCLSRTRTAACALLLHRHATGTPPACALARHSSATWRCTRHAPLTCCHSLHLPCTHGRLFSIFAAHLYPRTLAPHDYLVSATAYLTHLCTTPYHRWAGTRAGSAHVCGRRSHSCLAVYLSVLSCSHSPSFRARGPL